jgi:hypothetical protein
MRDVGCELVCREGVEVLDGRRSQMGFQTNLVAMFVKHVGFQDPNE